MSESSQAYQQLLHQVRDNHVGGIVWFLSNVYETALLNQKLQSEARVPLLISADLESGMGMRFIDTTFWPSAMAVAATGDPSLAEREGHAVAKEAKAVGINQIYAPVADVNVAPDNPVINSRSFGEDPQEVGRYVAAFIRGVQSEHVLATAKHFPGHGDTHTDSHRALPVLDVSPERLEKVELVPFRAAIEANVASIMIGHLSVPSLGPTPAPVRSDLHNGRGWGLGVNRNRARLCGHRCGETARHARPARATPPLPRPRMACSERRGAGMSERGARTMLPGVCPSRRAPRSAWWHR